MVNEENMSSGEKNTTDEYFMKRALELAKAAAEIDEVPVGAVAVKDGKIIAVGSNMREHSKLATHHAEIICIENACRALGGWRLPGVTLYVTMEPCVMCAGAIVNARIERVVYGAKDFRFGAFGSLVDIPSVGLNHFFRVEGGVLGEECAAVLSEYFKAKRKKTSNTEESAPCETLMN
jgi:tRNA(adenine34) deaminase